MDSIAYTPNGDRLVVIQTKHNLVSAVLYDSSTWSITAKYTSTGRIGTKCSLNVSHLYSGAELIWSTKNAIHFWNVDTGARRSFMEAKVCENIS